MSPDTQRGSHSMESILVEIDTRPFRPLVMAIVQEVSPQCDLSRINDAMMCAIRCACLKDLGEETGIEAYNTAFIIQRNHFYHIVPEIYHDQLEAVERDAMQFFAHEQKLRFLIASHAKYSWADVIRHSLGKSGDNLFYGKIPELMAPGWTPDHTHGLRAGTRNFDLRKDIQDYETDVRDGYPNMLFMALTIQIEPKVIPRDLPGAILAAQQTSVAEQLVAFATTIHNQVEPYVLTSSPTLREASEQRLEDLKRVLLPE